MRREKMKRIKLIFILLVGLSLTLDKTFAQDVTISVNANKDKKAVSPNIYGRNESFDKPDQFYKDAGLRFVRIGGGNNMSAYNWRKKLTVHPDWFNNVYGTDWDAYAQKISNNFPNVQGMFAFQLLGRAASTGENNFPDWTYMQAHPGWFGNNQNLAGGGTPNPDGGSKALVEGDIELFSEPWPADSSVLILDHWFGVGGKGFNKDQLQYWSMDNECDVWNGTHDWVMPTLISASEFMDRFIDLAKKAKALEPDIKICGPVTTSEWQWFKWSNESIRIDGKYYCWFEYFIKRCADEEKASGVRVLDVFDIHHYPYAPTDADALQNHRIFYDKTYDYPGANGLNTINGGWDTSSKKEYIFQRINDWLTKYFGENNGIKLGLSEWSPGPSEANLASVIYATHLGLFANNGVEYFTPWSWMDGMWETLHLFSKNAKKYGVSSVSSNENTVSAYTTVNENSDSTTIIIVNRDMKAARNVTVDLNGLSVEDGNYTTLQLSSLKGETFKSEKDNALKEGVVSVSYNSFTINVPSLSTTAILLQSSPTTGFHPLENETGEMKLYPNPVSNNLKVNIGSNLAESTQIDVLDQVGRRIFSMDVDFNGFTPINVNVSSLTNGIYYLAVKNSHFVSTERFTVIK